LGGSEIRQFADPAVERAREVIGEDRLVERGPERLAPNVRPDAQDGGQRLFGARAQKAVERNQKIVGRRRR
jgi:hypothetical protein